MFNTFLFLPPIHAGLPPIRSTTEFPGSWSFQISFGPLTESASRSATWTYSDVCKKLYVNLARFCPIKFKTTAPPPPGTYLRAVAVFKGFTNLHDIVKRCPNHMECANGGSAPKNHFIRSNNPAARYHTCPASARHSVLLPYHGPQVGEEWVTEMFAFMCFSSCQSGPSRRPVEVIFTLEKDGHTLGRRVVEIRVCACPGRDRKSDEEVVCGTWKDPPLRWTRGKRLGAGNFGEVYEYRERYRGILAVKIVKMEPQYTEKQKDVKALNNEISILKSLKHERIVSYHGSEQTDGHLHLFMDFMPGGSLSDHIKKYGVLSESKSKRFTQQMLEGICFLHSEDIIHRDIKGSNVLLDGDGNVKLADFGLSKMIQKVGSKTDLVSHCGTPHWMAPEIFWGEGYGRKADIWSLGCTVVEMLTGRPPLGHLEPAAAIFRIGSKPTEPTLPESVSQDAKEFIKVALTWKPNERPSSVELQCYTFVLNSIEDQ